MATSELKKPNHLIALKVLRLTQPKPAHPVIVTSDSKDLPGKILHNLLETDISTVIDNETLGSSQFMLLPQMKNIYLGERFSCYICAHNKSQQTLHNVTLKVDLQTNRLERIPLCAPFKDVQPKTLEPKEALDVIIHHEVKEIDAHRLLCEVSYIADINEVAQPLTFQEYFGFNVLKPLDLKTKFYTAESDEVYFESQIQNIINEPICLENVSLEASSLYKVTVLNSLDDGDSIFGDINSLPSQASRQYLYALSPNSDLSTFNPNSTSLGNLSISWRSEMGEKGRLQTSELHKPITEKENLRLFIEELPNVVYVNEPFDFKIKLTNSSDRAMDLLVYLESLPGLCWIGVSGKKIGKLEPKTDTILKLTLVPLTTGLQVIAGIKIKDSISNKFITENDKVAQIYVLQKE